MITIILVLWGSLCLTDAKKLSTTELVRDYGLRCETHEVVTKDGYILTIFRIPSPGKSPVIVMPGFLSSSNTWVCGPRDQNLVASLADVGYDVWLLNYRGSYYGRRHVTLDPEKDPSKFWDFTFHEIGTLDLPSLVDYVLDTTGFEKLFYIGHSMGGLLFYTMCTQRPDYCNKVKAAGLLAPVIFPPSDVDRALLSTAMTLVKNFARTARRFGYHVFMGNEQDRAASIRKTCATPVIGKSLCAMTVDLPFKASSINVDERTLPDYMVNTLSGTSLKLAEHMTQLMSSDGRIPMFNYGWRKNKIKYRSGYSPFYNGTISAPLIVFHSTSDPFTDQQSVNDLSKVSTIVYDKLITDETFNHINFLFSNHVKEYIIDDLIRLFNTVATL